jgi:hypothetical protein
MGITQEVREHAMAHELMEPRRIQGRSVRSHRTRFEVDEDPISEGGSWINGLTDGIDWADVVADNGVGHGGKVRMTIAERRAEQGDAVDAPIGDYDDPTAVLAGPWGRNQHARATVFSRNQTESYYQEVELRLRTTITPNSCTGYEVFWRCLKTENAYAEIVRWDGTIGSWKSLARGVGPQYGVRNGDVVEATIIGNEIRSYINGVEVLSATDDVYADGSRS